MNWFNLDFAGESREELDFLENKQDVWMSTTTLAMEVVGAYGRLQENREVILTDKWWAQLRYQSIGTQIYEKFKAQPELQKEMRAIFKS